MRACALALGLLAAACRLESSTPPAPPQRTTASGDLWVYTSMYRHVLDALEPALKQALPDVTVHWFQAGSEKVTARLEAELAGGGTQCDVLATSDPFLYARYKSEGRWLRYTSPNAARVPRGLVDGDGAYVAVRLSTMVLVNRSGGPAPTSFAELTDGRFKDDVVVGDPLTSGTAFTWAVMMQRTHGRSYFSKLRSNGARVAGGNAAVLQKVEGGEARSGVLLLENALTARAKGSPVEIVWPSDGAVLIPGYAGILTGTKHADAARAFVDFLLSPEGQKIISQQGDMHAVDPKLPGPRGEAGLADLLKKSQPWDDAALAYGVSDGPRAKADFSQAFAR